MDRKRVKTNVAYDKQYLEGRYGASPSLQQRIDWKVPTAKIPGETEAVRHVGI